MLPRRQGVANPCGGGERALLAAPIAGDRPGCCCGRSRGIGAYATCPPTVTLRG